MKITLKKGGIEKVRKYTNAYKRYDSLDYLSIFLPFYLSSLSTYLFLSYLTYPTINILVLLLIRFIFAGA